MVEDCLKYNGFRRFSKALNLLKGIVEGIKADGVINAEEMRSLAVWCVSNEEFIKYLPFKELIPMVKDAISDGDLSVEEIADILWVVDTFERDDLAGSVQTQAMNYLHGIIQGVLSDGELNDEEINYLNDWVNENDFLKGTYPYDEIESVIGSALNDGKITEDERNIITALISGFIDLSSTDIYSKEKLAEIQKQYSLGGICSINPDISFDSHLFCFTGISPKCTRNEIKEVIEDAGGLYNDIVTQKTGYLIVGSESSPCWVYSCYGRKVEKAIQLRKKGIPVQIVNELDFWDAL